MEVDVPILTTNTTVTARQMGGEVRDILMQIVAAERPAMVTTRRKYCVRRILEGWQDEEVSPRNGLGSFALAWSTFLKWQSSWVVRKVTLSSKSCLDQYLLCEKVPN